MKKQWYQSEKNVPHRLRRRAEVLLSERDNNSDELLNSDAQSLIHELQVHQIELEMQNEELRRAQIELEESRNKYVELYDFAPVGYITLNKAGVIVEANLTGATLLGIERNYLIKRPLSLCIAGESRYTFYSYIKRLFENTTRQTCELKVSKKDGTTFHAQLEGVAASDSRDGELNYLRLAVFDITARKRAEETLQRMHDELEAKVQERTWELAKANEALQTEIRERKRMEEELLRSQKLESLGTLAGGIAHDFNNLLTGILGYISLAKINITPEHKTFGRLTEAEKACLKASNLTQQLLTFSKGGAPIKKAISIGKLIRESANLALTGSNVRCEFSIPGDLWHVEADEGQISQAINNLVINAAQAMPEGGVIVVKAANIVVDKTDELLIKKGKYVRTSVEDTGIGIAKEHLSKIFDPYFTTKQTGSGLGLATTYSIVRSHEGHIGVESDLGVGTKVYVYLPAFCEEGSDVQGAGQQEGVVGGRGKVLVMDDEEIIREVAGGMLHQMGYEVEFAREGKEALELYSRAKGSGKGYDAVIMDLTIAGGMGGKETLKGLIEIDPEVRAIASSGYSNDPVMSEFKKYGFKAVIAKPYKIEELSKALYGVIQCDK